MDSKFEVNLDVASTINSLGNWVPGLKMINRGWAERHLDLENIKHIAKARDLMMELGFPKEAIEDCCSTLFREMLCKVNRETVYEFAQKRSNNGMDNPEVDLSWRYRFDQYAGQEFDEELQLAWAAVLAGECEEPGSYSFKTMSILADMNARDAESFKKVCQWSAGGMDQYGVRQPVIPLLTLDGGNTTYCGGEITYSEVSRLATLGLVDVGTSMHFPEAARVVLCIDGVSYQLAGRRGPVEIGGVTFTEYGDELQKMCSEETGKAGGLIGYVRSVLARQGIALEEMTINKILAKHLNDGLQSNDGSDGSEPIAAEEIGVQ